MWSFICFLISESLKLFPLAPRDWFLSKTVSREWSEDSDHAPWPLMKNQGPVTLFFLGSYRGTTYHLPSSGTTHPIPDNQPYTKRPSGVVHLQVEDFPALQALARQRQNILLVGKKKSTYLEERW